MAWEYLCPCPIANSTTPPRISALVLTFARRVVPGVTPTYVPVAPAPHAEVIECFPNVQTMIAQHRGTLEIGWQVWECPTSTSRQSFMGSGFRLMGSGATLPRKPTLSIESLFLPDPGRRYNGRQVDNIREALRDDQVIRHYLAVSAAIYRVCNKGDRAFQHGSVSIPRDEIERLLTAKQLTHVMLVKRRRDHDECVCTRGNKYKRCCGPVIKDCWITRSSRALLYSHAGPQNPRLGAQPRTPPAC